MVLKHTLDNGLTVLLEPIEEVVSVSVGLWVKSGSRNELDDQYGYAHFVEHMLFKGTENFTVGELARAVDRVGGQHNAATNREYTCYYINVVSDYLELALHILSDMYLYPLFDEGELEKEKNVIMEEIRMYEDTPDEFIHDFFMENMLQGHPLGHSILGSYDSIQKASRKSLVKYYQDHYTYDNTILAIAGNFKEKKALELINSFFKDITRDSSQRKIITSGAPFRSEYSFIHRKLEQIYFCLGSEGIKRNDDDRWPLYIFSTILGGSMSSRLFQNIREKEGISYSIYSFHASYSDSGVFGIYCATSPDTCLRAIELILHEVRQLLKEGITEEELEDTKRFMIGNLALSLESIEVRMGQLAKNELSYGRYYSYDDIVEKINNISLDDFREISDKIFRGKKLSLVSVGNIPESEMKSIDLVL